MRAIRTLITNALLVLAVMSFSTATARADTYSWTNFTAGIADEEHGLFGLITEDE